MDYNLLVQRDTLSYILASELYMYQKLSILFGASILNKILVPVKRHFSRNSLTLKNIKSPNN